MRFYQKTKYHAPCSLGWWIQNWFRIWNWASTAKVMIGVPTSNWQAIHLYITFSPSNGFFVLVFYLFYHIPTSNMGAIIIAHPLDLHNATKWDSIPVGIQMSWPWAVDDTYINGCMLKVSSTVSHRARNTLRISSPSLLFLDKLISYDLYFYFYSF